MLLARTQLFHEIVEADGDGEERAHEPTLDGVKSESFSLSTVDGPFC